MKTQGYSGKPLYQKLGMKPQSRWKVINPPDQYYDLLGEIPDMIFTGEGSDFDGIHIFCNELDQLRKYFRDFSCQIKKDGCIWFSWYKKSAKLPTEITEDTIRDTALVAGLVDVKVCAVDEKWSALKVVWRKENR